jgi:NhaP-type Na+/H+ or K+/H+ antiporter
MMYEILATLAVFAACYSVVAGRVERTWISGPIIFALFGLLIGPLGLGLLALKSNAELLKALAELTLAIVLFTDAAGVDLARLRRASQLPVRLLGIGLPLTILLGFGVGRILFDSLSIYEIALLATMLAPTDAALGEAVVTNQSVPADVRQGLNVESGLNDGICVPILLLFLTLAQGQVGDAAPWQVGSVLFLKVVGIGLACGIVLTAAAVRLLRFAQPREWLSPSWLQITVIAVAFACFGVSQALGGSGFIACFVGGMLFGRWLKPHHEGLLDAAEGIGDTFSLITWVLFGAAVLGQTPEVFEWRPFAYAVLSLTLIRMLPVFLVLSGLGMNTETKLFIGWFGPRGLASIVFIVIVLGAGLPNDDLLASVVAWTVILSITAHGVTANPWALRLGRRAEGKTRATPRA